MSELEVYDLLVLGPWTASVCLCRRVPWSPSSFKFLIHIKSTESLAYDSLITSHFQAPALQRTWHSILLSSCRLDHPSGDSPIYCPVATWHGHLDPPRQSDISATFCCALLKMRMTWSSATSYYGLTTHTWACRDLSPSPT